MLTALYRIARREGNLQEYRRQALNYGIVVGSFVVGAISLAVRCIFSVNGLFGLLASIYF